MAKKKTVGVRPLYDRVLLRRLDAAEEMRGGIIIPDTAKEKPIEATVVSVGNGKTLDNGDTRPLQVKAGDRVLFSKYAGTEVEIKNVTHLIVRESELLGVVE